MKTSNLLVGIIFLFLSQNLISQTIGSAFDKGFNDGYNETLRDAGYIGNYSAYGDSRRCQSKKTYNSNVDKNVNQKIYADGYRCGVKQATAAIPKIKNYNKQNHQNRNQYDNLSPQQKNAVDAYNLSVEQEKQNAQTVNYNQLSQQQQYNQNIQNSERQQFLYDQQVLKQLKAKQIQSQNEYNRMIDNTLSSLSNSVQAAVANNIRKEIIRRNTVANNFINFNSNRINKVNELYRQIPKENFNKNINGQFSAHLFLERKYSFVNGQKLVTEIPSLIKVVNNQIIEIYPYGKEGFQLDYPQTMPSVSHLSNGIVKYTDFNTLQTLTVILLEPYLTENPKQYSINKNGTGFLTLYTSKEKDEGRIVWIQEIDEQGNILREVSTPLIYADNEEDLEAMNIKGLPFNTEHELFYFGEPVQTPYGRFPLFMKTSKSDTKPLENNEKRIVRIKKYRD